MRAAKPWILVTGAAGFIAFHLIERLLREGCPVLGLDNLDPSYSVESKRRNIHDLMEVSGRTRVPFELLQDDATQLVPHWFAQREIGTVIHLAAKGGGVPAKEPQGYVQTNVMGTLRVLEFCRARRIGELLLGSCASVYGNDSPVPSPESAQAARPLCGYAASQRSAELFCHVYSHLYPLKAASLRFFSIYGPRQRADSALYQVSEAIVSGRSVSLYGNGQSQRDYTFVEDAAAAILGALGWIRGQRGPCFEVFNVGTGVGTSFTQLLSRLELALGTSAKVEQAPALVGDAESTIADMAKSRQAFGFVPQVGIEEGIGRFVSWFKGACPSARAKAS